MPPAPAVLPRLDDVLQLLDTIGSQRQFLVGSSMGAWLALHAALRRPHLVQVGADSGCLKLVGRWHRWQIGRFAGADMQSVPLVALGMSSRRLCLQRQHQTPSSPHLPLQGLLLLAPAVDISQHWQAVAQPAGVDAAGHDLVLLPSAYVEVRRGGWGCCPQLCGVARCVGSWRPPCVHPIPYASSLYLQGLQTDFTPHPFAPQGGGIRVRRQLLEEGSAHHLLLHTGQLDSLTCPATIMHRSGRKQPPLSWLYFGLVAVIRYSGLSHAGPTLPIPCLPVRAAYTMMSFRCI